MDPQKLVEMLQGTIHPETRELAEKQLNEVGFVGPMYFLWAKPNTGPTVKHRLGLQ